MYEILDRHYMEMKKRPVIIFLVICFVISFGAAGMFSLLGGEYNSIMGSLFASAYMFIPLVSVVITQLIVGETPFTGCGVSFKFNWWWVVGILSMLFFSILALPASAVFPGVEMTLENETMTTVVNNLAAQGLPIGPWGYLLVTLFAGIVSAATINALFAFGEEVAWRGFLARCFEDMGFWKKSALVGAIWGVWHAPIILMGHNYPDHPVAGVFMMTVFCMLLAPLMQFVRDKSKSVVASAMMHGSMNAYAGLSIALLSGYNDLLCGCCGVAGCAVLLLADVLLALRMSWKRS